MSSQDLNDAIKSINQSASLANATSDFFEKVISGDKYTTVKNPVDGSDTPTVQKMVYDQYSKDVSQIQQDVADANDAAARAEAAAGSAEAKVLRDDLASDSGSTMLGIGNGRKQSDKNSEVVSVKDWDGGAGVYGHLCHSAIEEADQWCFDNGKTLYFPCGQYCIGKSLIKKARWVGDGAAELAPFPQNDDDKIYMRPGHKVKLPGSNIILMVGATLSSVSTVRSDMFSSMTYAIKTLDKYPANMNGIGIVMDMDVYDASGVLTSPAEDNRAECDVGLLIDDSSASDFPNLVVFGYWNKAGTVIWSHGVGDNPDYTKFGFGSTMGYYGLALIGNDNAAGAGPGLSGTQWLGFQLFANDHHSRQPQTLRPGQTNKYGHLLFIDGNTGAADTDLNGHEFIAGGWRTYSNKPVVLDNCSNLHLVNVPFEFSTISGQPDTGNHKFYGTSQTRNVHILNSRNCTYSLWDHADFGDVVEKLMITNPFFGDIVVGSKGAYVRMMATGGGEDPRVQFTRNAASSEDGFAVRMDVSDSDSLSITLGGAAICRIDPSTGVVAFKRTSLWPVGAALVVTGGAISVSQNAHVIDATGSPSVSTINGGSEGELVQLQKTGSGTVTLVEGGNIVTPGTSLLLTANSDVVVLVKRGSSWLVQSFSDNA
ncbi:MAG: hypothetical protein ACRDAL_02575 [Plesiomonas shigelloides]